MVELRIDAAATSLPELIRWSTRTFAEHDAIHDGSVTLTYEELGQQVDRAARALADLGVAEGDSVAVWAPNCWQWVVAGLAVSRVGALLVPVNTRFKGVEAAYVLDTASVRVLFVVDGFLDTDYSGSLAEHDLADLECIVDLGGPLGSADLRATASTVSFDEFMSRGDDQSTQPEIERRTDAVGPDDVGVVMFTSGTTGHPKGVMVRGGAVVRAFSNYGDALGVEQGDPYLLVNPYFHAFGYNSGVIVCLLKGAINVPMATYDPESVLEMIERERIAVFPGPPAVFQGLLNHPRLGDFDISSLRSCVTGAASISVELIVDMGSRLGFRDIMTAYGMTETSGIAAYSRPGDPPELIASTSGRAIADGELVVVDDDGNEVERGTEGELLVRGFQVMAGYLGAPDQTAEALDADGWLHTGDIAVMDDAGYIDITDRKKDMFIMGGFNAYPAEIERVLAEHPSIGIAAVIGVPDQRMGEVGAAFIVPSPDGAPDLEELTHWCRERMANYKVPRHFWLVDELPLTASNKVRKPELRADATARLG